MYRLEDKDLKLVVGALMGDPPGSKLQCTDLAARLLREHAIFGPGDEVLWHESPDLPENRGEVQEVKVLGFPEVWDGLTLAYEVLFLGRNAPGAPRGCTAPEETLTIPEHELRLAGT